MGATGVVGTEDEVAARRPEGTRSSRRAKPAEVASEKLASEELGGADSTPDDEGPEAGVPPDFSILLGRETKMWENLYPCGEGYSTEVPYSGWAHLRHTLVYACHTSESGIEGRVLVRWSSVPDVTARSRFWVRGARVRSSACTT